MAPAPDGRCAPLRLPQHPPLRRPLRRLLHPLCRPPLALLLHALCIPVYAPSAPPLQCLRTPPPQPQRQLDPGQAPR